MPDKISFSSFVIKGEGLGRKIGFGTVNLSIPEKLPLRYGVYGCKVRFEKNLWPGALYFGPKTFGDKHGITLEIHLLPKNRRDSKHINSIRKGDAINVHTCIFVRKPETFLTIEEMVKRIKKDVELLTSEYWKKCEKDIDNKIKKKLQEDINIFSNNYPVVFNSNFPLSIK